MARRESDLALTALTCLRMLLAVLLLYAAVQAWRSGQPDGAALRLAIEGNLEAQWGLVRTWGRSVLLKNPAALAFVWPWALGITGAALGLDFRRRWASALGLVLVAHAHWFGEAGQGQGRLMIAALLLALFYAKGDRS